MGINRVCISGNVTRDGDLRVTQSGTQVLRFGVAVTDRRKNVKTGQWEDFPNFVDCTMFGNRAEALARYVLKGTKVAIEGKLRWSQWESDGQKRSKLEVVADEIEFLSRARSEEPEERQEAARGDYSPREPYRPQTYGTYDDPGLYDGPVPF